MKHMIKEFVAKMTHKRTQDLFESHAVDVVRNGNHVVVWVDNMQPLRKLSDKKHDEQIQKAVDNVCGEGCTYEIKVYKGNMIHERANHVQRQA